MSRRTALAAACALAAVTTIVGGAAATSAPQSLPFAQDWSDTSLITANDDWSGVPGFVGYRGDDLTSATGADPQTIVAEGTAIIDVNANQTNPDTFATGGVAEFHLADPAIALNGSGTADAPNLVLNVSTTGTSAVRVRYNLRDLDGSADDAAQQVALQYRIATAGVYINVPAGYVADATTAGAATQVTPVDVTLPAEAADKPHIQLRVITTNAAGNDEWVGIDDIRVTEAGPGDSAPSVTTTSPVNGATGVARNASVSVTFSEAVTPGAGAFTLACGGSSRAFTLAGGPTTYTLDPVSDFAFGESCTVTVTGTAISDDDATDPPDTMAGDHAFSFTVVAAPTILTIGSVQGPVADTANGATHASPRVGQRVTIRGVIYERTLTRSSTGANQRGFFIQNTAATADGDPTTSDGIFVFTSSFTTLIGGYPVTVGDEVVITGTVTEFSGLTQLTNATAEEVIRSGVGLELELPAVQAGPPDDVASAARYWERLEGMRVGLPAGSIVANPRVIFSAATTRDAEMYLIPPTHPVAQRANPYARRAFRDPHPLDNRPDVLFDDGNAYRVIIASAGVKHAAGDNRAIIDTAPTFSTLGTEAVGGVYFAFGKYTVQVVSQPQFAAGPDPAANHPPTAPNRVLEQTFSDYNVENLYDYRDDPFDGCDFTGNTGCPGVNPPFDYVPASDADYQNRLGFIARQIVEDLHAPDVVMTQEGEDQDICVVEDDELVCGNTNNADGKPDSLQELALRIEAIGGPSYDTAYDRNGADARGIISAFMFRTDRVELLPVTASDPVFGNSPQVVYDTAPLAYNADVQNPKALNAVLPPRAIDGTGTDGTNVYTRAPQVAAFRLWRDGVGTSVFTDVVAISNHFSSTPQNRVGQRREQALYNARIIDALDEARPLVITAGDFNVFPRPDDPYDPSSPRYPTDQLAPLYEHGLENLWDVEVAEAPEAAYSYVFDGNAQTLDQQFVSPALFALLTEARTAHVNADYPQGEEETDTRGLSDHDPMVSQYDASPTLAKLRALVELYIAQGRVTGNNTDRILRDRLDRIEQFLAGGQEDAALSQLQALADQARDMVPTRIDEAAAGAIAREAELLKELLS